MSKAWRETVAYVRTRASGRCEYCQMDEALSGIPCEVDHIRPKSVGGSDSLDNLCLACSYCNGRKWAKTEGIDPKVNLPVPLYNPRTQAWQEHFVWILNGLKIEGQTPIGRATVHILDMNRSLVVTARRVWILVGKHPP